MSVKAWTTGLLLAVSAGTGLFWLTFAGNRYILGQSSHPAMLYYLLLPGVFAVAPGLLALRAREFRPARFWIGTSSLVLLDLAVCAFIGMPIPITALALSSAIAGTALVTSANIIGPSPSPPTSATTSRRWVAAITSAVALVVAGITGHVMYPYNGDLVPALVINSPLLIALASPLVMALTRRPPGGPLACIGTIVTAQAVIFMPLTQWLLPSGALTMATGLVMRRHCKHGDGPSRKSAANYERNAIIT
jgi:hypothetical protein